MAEIGLREARNIIKRRSNVHETATLPLLTQKLIQGLLEGLVRLCQGGQEAPTFPLLQRVKVEVVGGTVILLDKSGQTKG